MAWTKTREAIAAIVAIVLIIIMLAAGSVVFGWNIPIISDIAQALGLA